MSRQVYCRWCGYVHDRIPCEEAALTFDDTYTAAQPVAVDVFMRMGTTRATMVRAREKGQRPRRR